jgi:hypothetical protein
LAQRNLRSQSRIQLDEAWGKPDKAAEWKKKQDYKVGARPSADGS